LGPDAERLAGQQLRVREVAGDVADLRPHLNGCDPDGPRHGSPPADRQRIEVSAFRLAESPDW
jgi:hypothetical protein